MLDEPGNGLDPQGIRGLREQLRSRAAKGGTVFVSSHLLAEVEQLADDVVVVNRGRLVATGALTELQQAGTSVRTKSPEPLVAILQAAGGTVSTRHDGELLVQGIPIAEIGDRACAAGIALHELSPGSGSLEELFLGWTGGEPGETPDIPANTDREVVPL
jgi:ABC-2 type transport system ATP-binding protein